MKTEFPPIDFEALSAKKKSCAWPFSASTRKNPGPRTGAFFRDGVRELGASRCLPPRTQCRCLPRMNSTAGAPSKR
jgi:hypothetical protein